MEKRLRLGLWVALLYFLSFILLSLIYFLWQRDLSTGFSLLDQIAVELCLLTCLILLRTQVGRRHLGLLFLGFSWSITIIGEISQTLRPVVVPSQVGWMMTFFSQATLMPVRWPLHLVSQLGVFAYNFGVNRALGLDLSFFGLPPVFMFFNLFWVCFICNLSVYLYERLTRSEFQARQKLEAEQERSERLLLNILPQSIAEQLKREQRIIADSFTEVTVLFADIVGFTPLAAQKSPTELVVLLNQIFSIFDQLAEQHRLEKIKTIGDAYMVVAGLPEPQENHAQAIADMALDMQQALIKFNQQTGQALNIRIGIHTGPVVAGVIGLKKFTYDLWGDTVNTASRMESHGVPGSIQVSGVTYECLKEEYLFEERGLIFIKGKAK